jgi:hypothetical protein
MEGRFDEVKLFLPGRKITQNGMAVGIDQTGSDRHPLNIEDLIHSPGIKIFLLANALNQSSLDDKRVSIQEGIRNVT